MMDVTAVIGIMEATNDRTVKAVMAFMERAVVVLTPTIKKDGSSVHYKHKKLMDALMVMDMMMTVMKMDLMMMMRLY